MVASAESITVRRLNLSFPAGLDPLVIEGQPEESYITVGLSLLLPYLEPYLIRTMHAAKEQVTDPELARALALFNAQEGQHYRQHIRFNDAIRMKGFEKLKELEVEIDADYKRFTASRSLRFNLAYAEGFEAFTMAMARFSFETKMLDRLTPEAQDLFRWHLVEELEHRTVAFDVYDHVSGGYFYRLVVGLFAQWHLNRFVIKSARVMLDAEREALETTYGGRAGYWKRAKPQIRRAARHLLPKILATYLPWYTPHSIEMPEEARVLAAHYSALAAASESKNKPPPAPPSSS
jgi:predicted metal-dependent hydrolase